MMKDRRERDMEHEMIRGKAIRSPGNDPARLGNQYPISNIQYPMIKGSDRRQGVALIVVLGFLSLMVLMAVAFVMHARMERMVAGATLEAMRGRQLLRTAVNAAMNDYSTYLWEEKLVVPSRMEDEMFVSEAPVPSVDINRTIDQDGVQLLVGEVLDWIPRKYTNAPYNAITQVPKQAEWILVRENPASSQSRILGRYAYVCFDMSGGMDANLIARSEGVAAQDVRASTNRTRYSVRDVPMGSLPETADANEFKRLRKGWKGFDSFQSVIKLTDGEIVDGNESVTLNSLRWQEERKEIYGAGLSSNLVSDLMPFSLSAYRGGRYDPIRAWTEPVAMNEATEWEALLAPFDSQFYHRWGSWINKAIYDYTHESQVPMGTDYPSPKNVPMFNEVAINYEFLAPGPGNPDYQLKLNLALEFWYPFPSRDNDSAGSFTVAAPAVGCGTAPDGPGDIWVELFLQAGGATISILPSRSTPPTPAVLSVDGAWQPEGKPHKPTPEKFEIVVPLRIPPSMTNIVATMPNITLTVVAGTLQEPLYLIGPGGNADMLPGGPPNPFSFAGAQGLAAGSASPTNSYAVTDPRMNHLQGAWVMETPPSLGSMNNWYTSPVKLQTAGMSDTAVQNEGLCMYCRNGPMESPAELGFISNGKEWGTIDLCTPQGADLMAKLVTTNRYSEWQTKRVIYTNGTINPNTRSEHVLLSAFYDLPANEVPNQPSERFISATYGAATISEEIARDLAERILAETDVARVSVYERLGKIFQFGSDWARIQPMQQNKEFAQKGLNNNQRESLIRNTWGLFSPEDSLFTVVAVAQAIKEGPGGVGVWDPNDDQITGERRAVALVWRDPFKIGTTTLHHEMFIRMFRYLND